MRLNRPGWIQRLVLLATSLLLAGASDPSERQLFDQVKARAEKGDAQAQLQLGSLYARGEGVEKDPVKAYKWHRKAAEAGLAPAQLALSLDYAYGRGVKPDNQESLKWLLKAAHQNLPEAQFDAGRAYVNGEGAAQNSVEAIKWFRLAAAQDLPDAASELGRCYFEGIGVPTDISEGLHWTRKAAQQGFPSAQNRLGLCYVKGEGVQTNYVEAYKWFSLAAAQDDEHADEIRVSLAKITRFMTAEQIAQAQRLAHDFKPGKDATANPPPDHATAGAPLDSSARTGALTVTAADEGCEVFVDGRFVGNAPAKLKLSEGTHVIEVKKAGGRNYRRELSVGAGSELTLRAELGAP